MRQSELDARLADERRAHAQSLQMLQEVRDYLLALPVVPATRAMARKVDDFLASPAASVARTRAKEQQHWDQQRNQVWEGFSRFRPDGSPELEAQLHGRMLTLVGDAITPIATGTVKRRTNTWAADTGADYSGEFPAVQIELQDSDVVRFEVTDPE